MRDLEDIQKAHDILWAFVAGEVTDADLDADSKLGLTAALDTLCWVLEHQHTQTFGVNLAKLVAFVEARGGAFRRVQ